MQLLRFAPEAAKYLEECPADEDGARFVGLALLAEIIELFRNCDQVPPDGAEILSGPRENHGTIFCSVLSTGYSVVYEFPAVFDSGNGVLVITIQPDPSAFAESPNISFLRKMLGRLSRTKHRSE